MQRQSWLLWYRAVTAQQNAWKCIAERPRKGRQEVVCLLSEVAMKEKYTLLSKYS